MCSSIKSERGFSYVIVNGIQEKHVHSVTKAHRLQLRWASRAALEQRKGRTGVKLSLVFRIKQILMNSDFSVCFRLLGSEYDVNINGKRYKANKTLCKSFSFRSRIMPQAVSKKGFTCVLSPASFTILSSLFLFLSSSGCL